MKRARAIAGTPVRSGFDSWRALTEVLIGSLESSSNIRVGSVAPELTRLDGLGPALAGGGYLDSQPIVLVADPLHVSFTIFTGAAAFKVDESEAIIPGSATAAADWRLYLPEGTPFLTALQAAVDGSKHLTVGEAPEESTSSQKSSGPDLDAIQRAAGLS